jgi:hypothetical protein
MVSDAFGVFTEHQTRRTSRTRGVVFDDLRRVGRDRQRHIGEWEMAYEHLVGVG